MTPAPHSLAGISYRVGPVRAGPALLLLHPLGADHAFWDACLSFWSADFTVVACDLRGAGGSPPAPRPWTLADHARDLEQVRLELNLTAIVPVGCAIGALIAAFYADQAQAFVSALVLCGPTLRIEESARSTIALRAAAVRANGMGALVPAAIDLAFTNMPKDDRYAHYTQQFLRQDPEGYALIAEGMAGADIAPALDRLRVPTLVLVGEHDRLFPPEQAKRVHERLAHSRFELLKNASHFPPFQDPEGFAQTVRAFLLSQPPHPTKTAP